MGGPRSGLRPYKERLAEARRRKKNKEPPTEEDKAIFQKEKERRKKYNARANAFLKKAIENRHLGLPPTPQERARLTLYDDNNAKKSEKDKEARRKRREKEPRSKEEQGHLDTRDAYDAKNSAKYNTKNKEVRRKRRDKEPRSKEEQEKLDQLDAYAAKYNAKEQEKNRAAGHELACKYGRAGNLQFYNVDEVAVLCERFALMMLLGYDDRRKLANERSMYRSSYRGEDRHALWLQVKEFDKKTWKGAYGGVHNVFLSESNSSVEVIIKEIEHAFGATVIKSFRENLDESMRAMKRAFPGTERGDNSFADMLALNHYSHYAGETRRPIKQEVYRFAIENSNQYKVLSGQRQTRQVKKQQKTRFLPNITYRDGRRITKDEMTSNLHFHDITGPCFPARLYSRLFETAWHRVTVAYLSVVLPQEEVIHGLTLWKAPGAGAYWHKDDDKYANFFVFITYSPFVYEYLQEADDEVEADRKLKFQNNTVFQR